MNAMKMKTLTACLALMVLAALCGPLCAPATAQNQASSDLLLPYFEVDGANPGGLTTLFAVGNSTDQLVEVVATVHTNWGIPILDVPFTLQAHEIRTVNLRDWFRQGGVPNKALSAAEVQHLVAAASGQRSPKDNLYYSTEIRPDLQVGYVTLRTQGNRPDALWGDWFNVDVAGNLARGDVLANIDRASGCPGLCHRHLLRYLSGGGFDGGTEVIIWRENPGHPSAFEDGGVKMQADATAFDEPGQPIENRQLSLLPVEKVLVSELGLKEQFGALDVETEEETFFAVQHTAENRYSVGLTTYCLPRKLHPGPGISIVKATNGEDADKAPGPSIPIGGAVTWDYLVTNTGNVELTDIVVVDDQEGAVSCPHDSLPPGDSMTCSKSGTAKACQYSNVGTVVALDPSGNEINDSDPSHYFGGGTGAALAFSSIKVNGKDAGTAPGPVFDLPADLNFTFTLTNTGKIRLTGILLSGTSLVCSKTALDPSESTDCTFTLKAELGKHSLPVTAKGNGGAACSEASVNAAGYYEGKTGDIVVPGIEIVKLTNGADANLPPGPAIPFGSPVSWSYKVTNKGQVALFDIAVTDDKGVAVSCPKTTLAIGESMTCTGSGTAQACQYANIGKAVANGGAAEDTDPSHYFGLTYPAIKIKKATNGDDADLPPGPQIQNGSTVLWTYVVTNTGDVALSNVVVTDNKGVTVTCPKNALAAGESMTCTGSGTAQIGQYQNIGAVTAQPPCGNAVSDDDPSHYYGIDEPGITIVKKTNGQDANTAPGPEIEVGDPVLWEYVVTNTGKITLTGIAVTDDKGVTVSCPKTTLKVNESMTCTGKGVAQACQYQNLGTATGTAYGGAKVSASDPSHYFGEIYPAIKIKKSTNGQDADTAPGPEIAVGAPVNWTYVVTNTGDVALTGVKVTDDKGVAVSCPKASLQPGESMTCTGSGVAQAGQYKNVGTVSGQPPCGNPVSDDDPSHYYGETGDLRIIKLTNGQDANTAPGPEIPVGSTVTWSYQVTNTGNVTLSNLKVTDDKGVVVSCPKTTLAAGESMTCTGSGKAVACQYTNIGTVTGKTPSGQVLTASDPSNYFGKTNPAIQIDNKVNGDDADSPKGPEVTVGSALSFTYIVKNTGDTTLTGIVVTDSKGVAVSCPKTTLAAGESMTCTGSGTAQAGQYSAIATATGNGTCGQNASDDDPVHYYGKTTEEPKIAIVKKTNGQDANTAPGPEIAVGSTVTWTYIVTNTGNVSLSNVKVTDDKGVAVSCPKTTLAVNETMTCTGSGKAVACQYTNIGTATGKSPAGQTVTANDPSNYYGKTYPAIEVEAKINGDHADTPKGPEFPVGSTVPFTYWVKNTGDTTLTGITVLDSKGVVVTCPKTSLNVGESMFCSGSGIAQAGQYSATATASGNGACGQKVSHSDPVHYYGKETETPKITIVKKTNGQDANTAPGPEIAVGSTVTWTYIVTNTGNVSLSNVKVTDDKGVAVSCPKTTLAVNETMTCTGSGKAVACQYTNIGTATGKSPAGQTVTANDPSNYYGKTYPAIEVEAKINGDHADTPKGPEFPAGSTVPFTYWVKNTGDTTLTGIAVVDSKGVVVTCPKTSLNVGESMFCSGSAIAQAGQYSATATASGNGSCGQKVSHSDPVHYYGKSPVYDEGCSHGYWKNHSSSWPATGYSTSQKVSSVFSQASLYSSLSNATLLASLSFSGGSDLTGAAGNLLKQATGSLLNSAHPDVDFPYSSAKVISDVNAALASKNSSTILALASALDDANNLGCPLN